MSDKFLDKTGLTYFWSKIKEKIENNRKIAKVGYTGSVNTSWYFPLVNLPKDNAGDYASFQIDGRLGGYSGTSMAKYSLMITNRTGAYTGTDITSAVLQFLNGNQTSCDIVAYAQEDKSAKVYIKVNGYFLFDFLYQNYQGTITYNGEYQTTEPDGTLVWSLSTAKKIYINNNGQLIGDITSSQISDRINKTSAGSNGWVSRENDDKLITNNTLAFWNGAYNDSNNSNIEYVKAGKISAQTAYTNKGNGQTVPKITTNSLGQITKIEDVEINPVTLQTHTYNRNGKTNIWAKVATTTITTAYAEKHAFLFIKGSHNSNYNENGIISIDALSGVIAGAVTTYRARFMTATKDLNLENFYIEAIHDTENSSSTINFWIKDDYNGWQSWQVKILQNSGWTIGSNDTSTVTLPSEGYEGRYAELFGSSLTSEQDGEGNKIVDTYATKTELSETTLNDLAFIGSKEYSGIYGSANNQAEASFYFANVKPTNYFDTWKIRYRVTSSIPSQSDHFRQYSDVTWYGNQNTVSYSNYNRLYSTNYRCYRYHNIYRLKPAGFNSGYSHVLGIGLRDATNPTNSSYPRNFKIEILETENCSVTFLDNMTKIANLDGYGSTNYDGVTETNGGDSGLLETNDSINIWQLRHTGGTYLCYSNLYRYQICFSKSENVLLPANAVDNTTGTSKTLTTESFNPFGQILYHNSTTAKNSGATVSGDILYQQSGLDLRYSFNTGTTLTSGKDVFVKCDLQSNGMVKLDPTTPIVQTLPTTEDGKVYIYLGHTYSNYQVELHATHPVYEYKDGALRLYKGPSEEVYTNTEKTKLAGIATGATANTGTVTSVAVKMNNTTKGTVTTSGTIDLGTVITAHQDISGKQDKLSTQTAYSAKGTSTKVPQITTNSLGQVTKIEEVAIETGGVVNNGTLTIQKNGTNVQTFTANQATNVTANISVPTAVSDLTNDLNYINLSKTSYNYNGGAIPGTKEAAATTIEDLIEELRFTNGQSGSFQLQTAYTKNGITLNTGWYFYQYIPHRFGGKDGATDTTGDNADNVKYGVLKLWGMFTGAGINIEYTITLEPDSSSSSGWTIYRLTCPQIYSSDEQIIGRWIDGSSIYRKVLTGTPSAQYSNVQHGISNLATPIKCYGFYKRNSDGCLESIPGNYTDWECYIYDFNSSKFTLRFSNNAWNSGIASYIIVIEYIKTA